MPLQPADRSSAEKRLDPAWPQDIAAAIHDLLAFGLEGAGPCFGIDARRLEHVAELRVRKPLQQARQKFAAVLADHRILERTGQRLRQVADAPRVFLPYWHLRPELEVHAADDVPVCQVGAAEGEPDVVHEHERTFASRRRLAFVIQADEALLL